MSTHSFLKFQHSQGTFTALPDRGRVYSLEYQGEETIWRAQSPQDWNIGGDRLWIGPERDWHWSDISVFNLNNYQVAEQIDPGSWQTIEQGTDSLAVSQTFRVQHRRKNRLLYGTMQRHFRFNQARGQMLPDLQSVVSWVTTDRLNLKGGTPGQGLNLWRILQVPVGGEMYVPSTGMGGYRLHFGDDSARVKVSASGVEAAITGGPDVQDWDGTGECRGSDRLCPALE